MKTLARISLQLRRLVAVHGVPRASKLLLQKLYDRLRGASNKGRRQLVHPFDILHSVDTSGMVESVDLDTGHRNDVHALAYYGVAPSVLRSVLQEWMRTLPPDPTIAEFTFVDLGAGKGRAVLLASELPFREVVGVELSGKLAAVAEENIGTWRAAGRGIEAIRVIEQDAADFAWPHTPLSIFLFNPFGPEVLEEALRSLLASFSAMPRPVYVLYLCPPFESAIERSGNFQLLWSRRFDLSEADRAVDAFLNKNMVCRAYRLSL